MAVAITAIMFGTKERMLGFPSAIFWAIFGGYCYTLSTTTWDLYYITFFAALGMTIFSMYAAYALRRRDLEPKEEDWEDSGKMIDEGGGGPDSGEPTSNETEDSSTKPSRFVRNVRDRADRRRSLGSKKKVNWGEFR